MTVVEFEFVPANPRLTSQSIRKVVCVTEWHPPNKPEALYLFVNTERLYAIETEWERGYFSYARYRLPEGTILYVFYSTGSGRRTYLFFEGLLVVEEGGHFERVGTLKWSRDYPRITVTNARLLADGDDPMVRDEGISYLESHGYKIAMSKETNCVLAGFLASRNLVPIRWISTPSEIAPKYTEPPPLFAPDYVDLP